MGEIGSSQAARNKRQELVDKLEKGIQRIKESDEFRRYLAAVARFHEYSVANTILIWTQCPEATRVAGFRTWLTLGRHVRKGETGIRIFAPMRLRRASSTKDEDERDTDLLRFRPVTVFDISQTEGEELPSPPITHLVGDEIGLWEGLTALAKDQGLRVDRGVHIGENGPNGFYDRSRRLIWVDPDLPPVMASKTLCHEIAHHFADHVDTRQEHETVAESVAFIVLGHFGIDASNYSLGYLAGWSDLATFKAMLACIQAIANRIIESITERRVALERNLGAGLPVSGQPVSETSVGTRPGSDLHAGM